MTEHPPPPSLDLSLKEIPRSGLETTKLLFNFRKLVKQAPPGDGSPVLTIPGYGGGDSSMFVIRYLLKQLGYEPYTLNLGVNYEASEERIKRVEDAVAYREKMVEACKARLQEVYEQSGQPVSLIGVSMGGLYAFDTAQQLPDLMRQVITIVAPFGDPRGVALFNLLRRINRSTVPIEEQNFDSWNNKRKIITDDVPIKVIYSPQDGFVSTEVARLDDHPAVSHYEVETSHVGCAVNPQVLELIGELMGNSQAAS